MNVNKMQLDKLTNEGVDNLSVEERRNFLKMGLVMTGVFAGGSLLSVTSAVDKVYASANQFVEKYPYKPHYSMIMHIDRCIDCEKCVAACAETNQVPS